MSPTPPSPVRRPDYLEGMRGFASWAVVFGHLLNAFFPQLTGVAVDHGTLDQLGWQHLLYESPLALPVKAHFAVLLFFTHSGLVLSFKYFTINASEAMGELQASAIRRYGDIFCTLNPESNR